MGLVGHLQGDRVVVRGDARQRFHDARGYGVPLEGQAIQLAPVEAAHLLFRGDLDAVVDGDDRLDLRGFIGSGRDDTFGTRFIVYADLRARGFYLVPAREPWHTSESAADFIVFERGSEPTDRSIEYAVHVRGERSALQTGDLPIGVLAVVDEESEVTYFRVSERGPEGIESGGNGHHPQSVEGQLLADRVILWNAPPSLYDEAFYGQPLAGRQGDRTALQCSLLEATYLAERGVLDLDAASIRERGRSLEGSRFDTRLTVFRHLRDHGVVAKTGYKFGADFRTYPDVGGVDELGHSSHLVRVHEPETTYDLRDLSLDVRLAHGVRKTMVLAVVQTDGTIAWRSLERLTP